MSNFLERFILDYITDKNALRRAARSPSPTPPPSFVNRPPWNKNTTHSSISDEKDVLRSILREKLLRGGFGDNYKLAARNFENRVADQARTTSLELQMERHRVQQSAFHREVGGRLSQVEKDELIDRRQIHKRFISTLKTTQAIMNRERVLLFSQVEFQNRRELVKHFIFAIESMRREETSEKYEILRKLNLAAEVESQSNAEVRHRRANEMQTSETPRILEHDSSSLAMNKSHISESASSREQLEISKRSRSTKSSPRRHENVTPLRQRNNDTTIDFLSPLTPSNQKLSGENGSETQNTTTLSTHSEPHELLYLVKQCKSFFVGISLIEVVSGVGHSQTLGLTVDGVHDNGPGAVASIKVGDVIVAVAGVRVSNFNEFREALCSFATIGSTLPFIIIRSNDSFQKAGDSMEEDDFTLLELDVLILTKDKRFASLGESYYYNIE